MKKKSLLISLACLGLLASCGSGNSSQNQDPATFVPSSSIPAPTVDGVDGPVTPSPVNPIDDTKFDSYARKFIDAANSKVPSDMQVLPYFEGEQLDYVLAQLGPMLQCSHLTDTELNVIAALAGHIYGAIYVAEAKAYQAAPEDRPVWTQVFMQLLPEFAQEILSVLGVVNVDHILSTLNDIEALLAEQGMKLSDMFGGQGSAKPMHQFDFYRQFIGSNARITDFFAAVDARQQAQDEANRSYTPQMIGVFLDSSENRAILLRFAWKLILHVGNSVGASAIPEVINNLMKFLGKQEGAFEGLAAFIRAVAPAAENHAFTDHEIDVLIKLYADYFDYGMQSSRNMSFYCVEATDQMMKNIHDLLSLVNGKVVHALLRLAGILGKAMDAATVRELSQGDVVNFVRQFENAYAQLDASEKSGIKAILDYFGINLDAVIAALKESTPETLGQILQEQFSSAMVTAENSFSTSPLPRPYYSGCSYYPYVIQGSDPESARFNVFYGIDGQGFMNNARVTKVEMDTSKIGLDIPCAITVVFDDIYPNKEFHYVGHFEVVDEIIANTQFLDPYINDGFLVENGRVVRERAQEMIDDGYPEDYHVSLYAYYFDCGLGYSGSADGLTFTLSEVLDWEPGLRSVTSGDLTYFFLVE